MKSINKDETEEITIEVNPGTVTEEKLKDYLNAGINRLSIGLQSTNNKILQEISRIHTFEQFLETYKLAKEVGFDNINIDLMIGLPNQKLEDVQKSLEEVIKLKPRHVSVYSLILEPGTVLERKVTIGALEQPSELEERKMYWLVKNTLENAGFKHYEISNFAKPGFRSRHNFKYWDLSDYLGLGPGAHSFLNGRRFAFARDIRAYISGESIPQDEEEVSDFRRQGEYLMVRLRTSDGADMHDLENRYHVSTAPYEQVFCMLEKHGLAAHEGTRWYLTEQGFLVSNSIINAVVEAGE